MVKADRDLIESLRPGVISGRGVFETMRVHDGRIFFLQRHWRRMFRGLKLYGLVMPYSVKKLTEYLYQTVQRNNSRRARLRLAVWRQNGRLRTSIICQPQQGPSQAQYQQGYKAAVSKERRNKTRFSHVKSMDYGLLRKELLKARDRGYDEVIFLNKYGELAEGATTNLFFVKNNILFTPAAASGCLNGITRQIIKKCAFQAGIRCRAVRDGISRLMKADEAFLTNSVIGLMPLTHLKGRPIGSGRPGPITLRLLQAYQEFLRNSSR